MMLAQSITDVGLDWPTGQEILRVLTFRAGYNTAIVTAGATSLGIAGGIIGTFMVLRKRSLMADALSHSTLPGIAIAFLIATALGFDGKTLPILLTGAAVAGVLGVLCVQAISRHTRLTEDTAIGTVLSVFFGAGIVLLSVIQSMRGGNQAGLDHFLLGQTASLLMSDAILIAAVAGACAIVALLMLKEFRLVCFDDSYASAQGWPVTMIDMLMMALVVVVTVIGLQAVGLVLVVAMLIIPASAARFWTERLGMMTLLGGVIGGMSGYFGASASALLPRLPAGPVIVLVAGLIFAMSMLLAPNRGVLAAAARQISLRVKIGREHVLRGIYERLEVRGDAVDSLLPVAEVRSRSSSGLAWWFMVRWLAVRGFITRTDNELGLTPRGVEDAVRLTRNHRLWEKYLVEYADIAASHVDRSADLVEHVLSKQLVEELEHILHDEGRLPGDDEPIKSVHPLPAAPGKAGT